MVYFPVEKFRLPCGLAVFESFFESADGNRGVLGGPHYSWIGIKDQAMHIGPRAFFTQEVRAYSCYVETLRHLPSFVHELAEDTMELQPVEHCNKKHCKEHHLDNYWMDETDWELTGCAYSVLQDENRFFEIEDLGTDTQYRCVACRNCAKCRQGDVLEKVSLREEVEQAKIEESVTLNTETLKLEASLPFIRDPAEVLTPNRFIAEKVFESQMRHFAK